MNTRPSQQYLFVVLATAILFSNCKKDDDVYTIGNPDGVPIKEIIYYGSIDKMSLEADSLTTSTFNVNINPATDSLLRLVIVKTSLGIFKNGRAADTIPVNAYGKGSFTLLSNQPGTAKVTAVIKGVAIDTSIVFIPALPDDLLATADKNVGNSTSSFIVTTSLFRNPGRGKISDPVKVLFEIIPEVVQPVTLLCPPFALSSNKTAVISVSNPFGLKGNFMLKVSVEGTTAVTRMVPIVIQ